jgi:hypothetical protein
MTRALRKCLTQMAAATAIAIFTSPLAAAQSRPPGSAPPPEPRAATVRVADSLWNGAAIGAGAAVAGGLFLCTRTEPWRNCRDDAGPMLRIGAVGAGIGMAIDALIRKRVDQEADGRRLDIAPLVSRRNPGILMTWRF